MEMLNSLEQRQGNRLRLALRQLTVLLDILREQFAPKILGDQIYDIGKSFLLPSRADKARQIVAETQMGVCPKLLRVLSVL